MNKRNIPIYYFLYIYLCADDFFDLTGDRNNLNWESAVSVM